MIGHNTHYAYSDSENRHPLCFRRSALRFVGGGTVRLRLTALQKAHRCRFDSQQRSPGASA